MLIAAVIICLSLALTSAGSKAPAAIKPPSLPPRGADMSPGAPVITRGATPIMPECEPYYIAGVYTAVCMRRRLTHVPRYLMTSIQVMDASNNEMVAVRDGEFQTYPWLTEIYLQDNKIRHIGRNAFMNLTRLRTLVLTSNDLNQIDGDMFRPLANLRVLRLSNNPLRILRRDNFRYLRNLVELRVDSCLLTKIEPGTIRPFIGSLEVLSVAYNQLTIFTADMNLPSVQMTHFGRMSNLVLKELHLYGNPWHCNCQMRVLRRLLSENSDIAFNFGSDLKSPSCFSPPSLAGQIWSRIQDERFGCEPVVTSANMPPMPRRGSNVTLQCSFAADPSPTFRWFKDGIPISTVATHVAQLSSQNVHSKIRQQDRKIAAHNFTSRLELIEVTKEFSGSYECVAENTAGASKSKFLLRIRGPDGRYEPLPEGFEDGIMESSLLQSLVSIDTPVSTKTRLIIVAGVVGTVLILFTLLSTLIYFCCCKRSGIEQDNSAVAILRKIEAKRLALNSSHDATLSLRKNILSNSSSLHSHIRSGDDVKLTEVFASHLSSSSPESNEDNGTKRESSNSTVVTNDRSSSKASPDNSTADHNQYVDHDEDEMDESLSAATPLCYFANKNRTNKTNEDHPTIEDLAMVQSAAYKTYSEYLSLTLPKIAQSPRVTQRSNSGAFNNHIEQRNHGNALLHATLSRQIPPILNAYGYVEQPGGHPPPNRAPKASMNDLSDLSDVDSASQSGAGDNARMASSFHHQYASMTGRRQQRHTGELPGTRSIFMPMTFTSMASNQGSKAATFNSGNLVHFLDEPTPKVAISTSTSGDTSV